MRQARPVRAKSRVDSVIATNSAHAIESAPFYHGSSATPPSTGGFGSFAAGLAVAGRNQLRLDLGLFRGRHGCALTAGGKVVNGQILAGGAGARRGAGRCSHHRQISDDRSEKEQRRSGRGSQSADSKTAAAAPALLLLRPVIAPTIFTLTLLLITSGEQISYVDGQYDQTKVIDALQHIESCDILRTVPSSRVTTAPSTEKKFDPEAFALNLAKAMESSGQALAAYLKPAENGAVTDKPPSEVTEIIKTFGTVAEYWLSDQTRSAELQTKLGKAYLDLWGSAMRRMAYTLMMVCLGL
eukprot:gene35747-48066_t